MILILKYIAALIIVFFGMCAIDYLEAITRRYINS